MKDYSSNADPQAGTVSPSAESGSRDVPRHTPGPWDCVAKLSASENHKGFRIWRDGQGWIADVSPRDEDGKEGEANARLIAAAPGLLRALQTIACFPAPEQDNMPAANMRLIAQNAVDAAHTLPESSQPESRDGS